MPTPNIAFKLAITFREMIGGMAIWAKKKQICSCIVSSVPVYMMYFKNLRNFIISTSFASVNTFKNLLLHSRGIRMIFKWLSFFSSPIWIFDWFLFSYKSVKSTFNRAKPLIFMPGMTFKFIATAFTCPNHVGISCRSLIKTLDRTPFLFIAWSGLKNSMASLANSFFFFLLLKKYSSTFFRTSITSYWSVPSKYSPAIDACS